MTRTGLFIKVNNRHRLIVYDVLQKRAIDLMDGRNYLFAGDTDLSADDFIRNFHSKPSRVLHRIEPTDSIVSFYQNDKLVVFRNKKIFVIDSTLNFKPLVTKLSLDLLIVSNKSKLYFKKLAETFDIKLVVFDGSVPAWKMKYWKNDCNSLQIPYYDVIEKGAFVMNLN